jgi:hypothetical protein
LRETAVRRKPLLPAITLKPRSPEEAMTLITQDRHARSRRRAPILAALFAVAALAGCEDDGAGPRVPGPAFSQASTDLTLELASILDQVNLALAAQGADIRAGMAEYITDPSAEEAGSEVIAKDVGNRQLGADFVPHDPRREWSGPADGSDDDITFAIDRTGDAVPPGGGLTAAQTTGAIQRAMATWDGATCSTLPIFENPDFGLDIGIVAFQNGLGGGPFVFADVQHAGWRDINFAAGILGVTFTFIFIDENGDPTDIDGNGRIDVAFREIYYDPSFVWAIDQGPPFVDVESIAVHEAGHGLSQAHFGKVSIKNDGSLKASPKAVMNALYFEVTQSLRGTDSGGHCSNWSAWPNK